MRTLLLTFSLILSQLRTLSSLSSFSFLSRRHWKVNQWVALGQRTQAMDAVEQLLVAGGNDARRVAEIAVQVSGASKDIEMACEWKPLPAGDWDRGDKFGGMCVI